MSEGTSRCPRGLADVEGSSFRWSTAGTEGRHPLSTCGAYYQSSKVLADTTREILAANFA